MFKAFATLSFLAFSMSAMAASTEPTPAPDPKMPPMPSMEAPDSNDMTKPAGTTKSVAAPKAKVKQAVPAPKGKKVSEPVQSKTRLVNGGARKNGTRKAPGRRLVKEGAAPSRKALPSRARVKPASRGAKTRH